MYIRTLKDIQNLCDTVSFDKGSIAKPQWHVLSAKPIFNGFQQMKKDKRRKVGCGCAAP